MAKRSMCAIIVCGDLSLEKHKELWLQDCCAATQNLLIAAHALGIGAVWTAIYPREERVAASRRLFKLPEHVIPLTIIPMGWPKKDVEPVDTYKPDRIHLNGWGNKANFT